LLDEEVLLVIRCSCILSGLMLFREAFWDADAIASESTSTPTAKAAPNW